LQQGEKSVRSTNLAFLTLALMSSQRARAAELNSEPHGTTTMNEDAMADGLFLPLTLSPRVGGTRAQAWGWSGYDSSRKAALFDAGAEVTLWGPIALRGGAVYSDATSRMRPYVAARVQVLRQEAHGINAAFGVSFKTEGFTEAEGEVETFASIGRRIGTLVLVGNLVYGQDPEGNERDGELRASAFQQRGRLALGIDSRVRSAIGTQAGRAATTEPKFDAMGGPVAMAVIGPFVIFAEAGPSAFKMPGLATRVGLTAFGGLGSAF
jgi:hypothetical protein